MSSVLTSLFLVLFTFSSYAGSEVFSEALENSLNELEVNGYDRDHVTVFKLEKNKKNTEVQLLTIDRRLHNLVCFLNGRCDQKLSQATSIYTSRSSYSIMEFSFSSALSQLVNALESTGESYSIESIKTWASSDYSQGYMDFAIWNKIGFEVANEKRILGIKCSEDKQRRSFGCKIDNHFKDEPNL